MLTLILTSERQPKFCERRIRFSAKPGFVDRLISEAYADAADELVTFEKAAGRLKSARVL